MIVGFSRYTNAISSDPEKRENFCVDGHRFRAIGAAYWGLYAQYVPRKSTYDSVRRSTSYFHRSKP